MKSILVAAFLLCCAGCASGPTGIDLAVYPAAIAGSYDNAAQYAAAPEDMKDPPSGPEDDWLDRQGVAFRVVSAPGLAPAAVQMEWVGGRQRLWTFRQDAAGVRMDIHELVYPAIYAGGAPAAFALLTESGVRTLPPGCALTVNSAGPGAWNAQTDPETCQLNGADLDIRVTVMPTGVLYQEQARRPDGTYAFRTPAPAPYDFRRR